LKNAIKRRSYFNRLYLIKERSYFKNITPAFLKKEVTLIGGQSNISIQKIYSKKKVKKINIYRHDAGFLLY